METKQAQNSRPAPQLNVDEIAAVIPAYNEETSIADVVKRALAVVPRVIVVDDGSSDRTIARLEGLPITLIRHEANLGKGASLMSGFRKALQMGMRGVITLDGDGQHHPESIQNLLKAAAEHPTSIVLGSRLHDRQAFPKARLFANEVANFWISWACGQHIEDSQSGFRYYSSSALSTVHIMHNRERGFVFESEYLIEAAEHGIRTVAVPIPAVYGGALARPSHFRPLYDISRIVRMVAWKLIRRGMNLAGLARSLRERHRAARSA